MDLAKIKNDWSDEVFSMPVLALRLSDYRNGVSKLHGAVSRSMWQYLWPGKSVEEVPISYITNGVHTGTWLARRLAGLYDQYLDEDWRDRLDDQELWDQVESIPDNELWQVRIHLKRKLVSYMVARARHEWEAECQSVQTVGQGVFLDPLHLRLVCPRFALIACQPVSGLER